MFLAFSSISQKSTASSKQQQQRHSKELRERSNSCDSIFEDDRHTVISKYNDATDGQFRVIPIKRSACLSSNASHNTFHDIIGIQELDIL